MSEMEVVWSGTLDRRAAESARTYVHHKPSKPNTSRVLEFVRAAGEATMPQIAVALGIDQHAVNGCLYQLRNKGIISITERVVTTANGRFARFYKVASLQPPPPSSPASAPR